MAHGHPPLHCENTQVLREAITEDNNDDEFRFSCIHVKTILKSCFCCQLFSNIFFFRISFRNTIRVSNGFDQD